jgi:hypothetical protein
VIGARGWICRSSEGVRWRVATMYWWNGWRDGQREMYPTDAQRHTWKCTYQRACGHFVARTRTLHAKFVAARQAIDSALYGSCQASLGHKQRGTRQKGKENVVLVTKNVARWTLAMPEHLSHHSWQITQRSVRSGRLKHVQQTRNELKPHFLAFEPLQDQPNPPTPRSEA